MTRGAACAALDDASMCVGVAAYVRSSGDLAVVSATITS